MPSELFESSQEPFIQVQRGLRNYIRSIEWFKNIPVVAEEEDSIESQLDLETGSVGVVVALIVTSAILITTETSHPYYDLNISAGIFENATVNRSAMGTRKPCLVIAQYLAHHLHNVTPEGLGLVTLRAPAIELIENPNYLQRSVNINTHVGTVNA